MDSSEDWRSLLNFKYAEPEYQALFSGERRAPFPPPPPPSSSSLKRTSVDGESQRSDIVRVEDVLDGRPLYEQFPAIRFPPLQQPSIPEPLDEASLFLDVEGLLANIHIVPQDSEIIASVQFLKALIGNTISKAVELRQSIIDHAAYIHQLNRPVSQEDTDYVESTIFPNYVSMKDELQDLSDELSNIRPWKVRKIFLEDFDENGLINEAGGTDNNAEIMQLLSQSYGAGHRFIELEKAIVALGQYLQDQITLSIIAVSELHEYTAAMVRYPPGPYPKAVGVQVRWDSLNEANDRIVANKSALSQDFERFMLQKHLTVTNNLFSYLQHPAEYGYILSFSHYRFGPGEFSGMMEWLENQDSLVLKSLQSNLPTQEGSLNDSLRAPECAMAASADSILRSLKVLVFQHCTLTDRDAHRLAQAFPRLTHLSVLNLASNALSQSAMASMASVVMENPHCILALQLLYLDDNKINSDGAQLLSQILYPHCPRLLKLSLNGNPIGDKGAYQILRKLLNPQRRAFDAYPALQLKSTRKSALGMRAKKKTAAHFGGDDEDEEDDNEEEVLMTLDKPTRRASSLLPISMDSHRFRGSILFGDKFTNNLTQLGQQYHNASHGTNEEVQLAVQSQGRYPLHCYLSDFFAPPLVLETLRSLLAAAEYDIQHGGDGKASLRQHHYLFQQQKQKDEQENEEKIVSKFAQDGSISSFDAGKVSVSMNYDWVNDPDVDEFNVDIASDYSKEDSEDEDRRLTVQAILKVQKLRGIVVSSEHHSGASVSGSVISNESKKSPTISEADKRHLKSDLQSLSSDLSPFVGSGGFLARGRSVPKRTLTRIDARIQKRRQRIRRRARLTYRERLILREKKALGVHKTRRALRLQQAEKTVDGVELVDMDDEDADDDLLEESSDEDEADYHESDEDYDDDDSEVDIDADIEADHYKMAIEHGRSKIDSDEETEVLGYSNKLTKDNTSKQKSPRVKRGSMASQSSQFSRIKARAVLSVSLLQLRSKQNRVFQRYPKLVQVMLKLRLKLIAVSLFSNLRCRTQMPYLAALSLSHCRLTPAILPALAVVLREDVCLMSLDISHNPGLLAKQEDCRLLASSLRYSLQRPEKTKNPTIDFLLSSNVSPDKQKIAGHEAVEPISAAPVSTQREEQFYATSLQHLALNHVDMTDAGIVALTTAFAMPSSPLTRIELRGNWFGPTAVNVLANLCQRSHFYLGSAAMVHHNATGNLRSSSFMDKKSTGATLRKVKPPVFSAENKDFHRDEGFLVVDEDASDSSPLKPGQSKSKNESKKSNRRRRESLALGNTSDDQFDRPMRLVDEDENSLDSFHDGDTWTLDDDEEEDDFDDDDDDEDF